MSINPELKKTDLFTGMEDSEIQHLLRCSGAVFREYEKSQEIFLESERVKYIYVLLKGRLLVSKHYSSGRRNIFCEVHEEEIFGILIHMEPEERYWYDAIAVTDCQVLCISWDFLFDFCPVFCEAHKTFLKNMIRVQADISVSQMKKLSILSGSTVEAKLGRLLLDLSDTKGFVELKMNREELADFLGITRPSLSRSLMLMQKKGIIRVNRSRIWILAMEELEKISVR